MSSANNARLARTLRLASIPLVAATGFALVGAAQQSRTEEPAVKMLGICSYEDSKVNCWSPSGRRDGELGQRLDRVLRSRGEYSFQYRFGRKNRLLVFELAGRNYVNFSSPGDRYLNATDVASDDLGPVLKLLSVAADPERKTGSVSAIVQTNERAGTTATPLSPGTKLTIGPIGVEIGVPEIGVNPSYNFPGRPPATFPRRRWTYSLTLTSPPGTVAQLNAVAMDQKGEMIQNVDADGKPIPFSAPDPNENRGNDVLTTGTNETRNTAFLATTIDPALIKEIRWSASLNRRQDFKDFALDPKR